MKTAWLFPGQGAQTVGMGRRLHEASAAAREVFAAADAALDEPLSAMIFEGPEEALTRTANAQPAIVTTSIATLAAVRERWPALPSPSYAAGHSLGEYSALVAAEALALPDAVRLVRARGRAMQEAVPEGAGAMAAIMGLDGETLEGLCKRAAADTGETVSCANFNAPGQVVIAGTQRAVARASALASEAKGKAIPLKVSAPFHCALMAPAATSVASELDRVVVNNLVFPVVANVDAKANREASRVKELLVRQVDGAVRWEQAVRLMHAEGVTHAVELGPGKVLAGLLKRIAKDVTVLSVSDPEGVEAVGPFLGLA
ncbi:MAG: ACP S-malonyltransferase [Myxococcales bacterium]|nr:ACP S-malonyltransferase [Myxococcales bacterium]MBL0192624.1 ACP S-malonyltransferase [Myxococcales bacterium]HQY62909.1 ACP S-malonyltransferase [Polyangiaceae bacterium]